MEITVREFIKCLIDFNPDAKLSVVHDGLPVNIMDFGWAVKGFGDSNSKDRDIKKEKANATFVYINCDKVEN